MRERMVARLEELRRELTTGRMRLQELQEQQTQLQQLILRISGAVQVLEELLGEEASTGELPATAGGVTAPPADGPAAG